VLMASRAAADVARSCCPIGAEVVGRAGGGCARRSRVLVWAGVRASGGAGIVPLLGVGQAGRARAEPGFCPAPTPPTPPPASQPCRQRACRLLRTGDHGGAWNSLPVRAPSGAQQQHSAAARPPADRARRRPPLGRTSRCCTSCDGGRRWSRFGQPTCNSWSSPVCTPSPTPGTRLQGVAHAAAPPAACLPAHLPSSYSRASTNKQPVMRSTREATDGCR
jgi:hypothetical protein